ncbi:hypothetical protein ACIQXG_14535 [Lysinibacillus sphaericus]|uniref:hypothetical protein n=1 Tax=Lysinibacillus sphaericus TaxID=1421 RepID=UPI0037FFB3C8
MENHIFYRNRIYFWQCHGISKDGDIQLEIISDDGPVSIGSSIYFDLEKIIIEKYGVALIVAERLVGNQ